VATDGDFVIAHDNHPSLDDDSIRLVRDEDYEVTSVEFKDDNSIIYSLDVDGTEYSFYAGSVNPFTHDEIFKIGKAVTKPEPTEPKPEIKYGRLSKKIWWKKIYKCPSTSCSKAGTIRGPRLSKRKLKIHENKNGWLKVEQKGKVGWIQQWYVKIY
jgi:hypothetical protein